MSPTVHYPVDTWSQHNVASTSMWRCDVTSTPMRRCYCMTTKHHHIDVNVTSCRQTDVHMTLFVWRQNNVVSTSMWHLEVSSTSKRRCFISTLFWRWCDCWVEVLTLAMLKSLYAKLLPGFYTVNLQLSVVSMHFKSEWETAWNLIRLLHQMPADRDQHCDQKRINTDSAGLVLIFLVDNPIWEQLSYIMDALLILTSIQGIAKQIGQYLSDTL